MQKKVFIIDGSSFLYRAYYALKPMHTSQGVPVGAVYGFCRMLKKLIDTQNPTHLAIAWDSKGATVRHELLPSYKETRLETPSDIHEQKALIEEFARMIGICQIKKEGIEADDIMYSLALDAVKKKFQVVLVTSDKDMGQMVDANITIYDTFKDQFLDTAALEAKYTFSPEKIPFYFALVGDSSDNIPGVAGIGPKGATELVKQFDSLQQLYEHISPEGTPFGDLKDRTRALLLANKKNAFLSEQLFLLRYYDLGVSIDTCSFQASQWLKARPFFESVDFKSLLKDMPQAETQAPEFLSKKHGFDFVTIDTEEKLKELCAELTRAGAFALDTETDGLDQLQAQLVGISIAYKAKHAVYIPIHNNIKIYLKPILENPNIKKYLHHTKFDQHILANAGIKLQGVTFDTLIAADLICPDWQKLGLKQLSQTYLGQTMLSFQEVMKQTGAKNFKDVPLELATEYAAADAHQVLQLKPIFEKKLEELELKKLFTAIEMPLIQTLFSMEREGIIVDPKLLSTIDTKVTQLLARIKQDILTLIGAEPTEEINLNAPRQIEEILFTRLQLTPLKKTAKKTGYSTDAEVLEELAREHPVPELIIKYRELAKLKSTYIDALPTFIKPHTERIHTNFSQTATATGRLASSEPNLQNIPLEHEIEGLSIRSAFKAPADELFLSADYSQIELRVLAYYSKDPALVDAFLRNQDIHAATAAGLFGVPLKDVTSQQRQVGKRINFSILYGLTPYGLSKDLRISYTDAQQYIDRYFAQYPQVSAWMASVIEEAKDLGYVSTYAGRRRYIPGIYEKNKTLYDLACRVAINTKAQGTAADIMKLGMNALHTRFAQESWGAKIILQIHDELLISIPASTIAQVEPVVIQLLQDVVAWPIPLIVTTAQGRDWHEVS